MSSLDVLEREVLHSGLVTAPSGDAVRLREPKSPMKEVVVKVENPDRTLVLRIDKAKVNGLFQRGRGQLKRCDYVIFTEIGGQRYLVFAEMKNKEDDGEEIVRQFKGAECLLDYVDSVLRRFYEESSLLREYEKRFVLFYKTSIRKGPTRPRKKAGKNRKPEQYLRRPVSNQGLVQAKEIV